jgi:hypothetical protein
MRTGLTNQNTNKCVLKFVSRQCSGWGGHARWKIEVNFQPAFLPPQTHPSFGLCIKAIRGLPVLVVYLSVSIADAHAYLPALFVYANSDFMSLTVNIFKEAASLKSRRIRVSKQVDARTNSLPKN